MEDTTPPPGADEARFAENVLRLREQRGWSQTDLSRRMLDAGFANFNQMTVSRTEKGDRPIRLTEARGLASVFNRTVDDMIQPPEESQVRDELLSWVAKVTDDENAVVAATEAMLLDQMFLGEAIDRAALQSGTDGEARTSKIAQRIWAETSDALREAHARSLATPEDAVKEGRRIFEETFRVQGRHDSELAGEKESRGSAASPRGEVK